MAHTGKIKWFNATRGYGFIKPDKGDRDIFIHISALKAIGIEDIEENQKIEYDIVEEKGKKSAGNIKKI